MSLRWRNELRIRGRTLNPFLKTLKMMSSLNLKISIKAVKKHIGIARVLTYL
jgi:hypothetical protein